MSVIDTIQVRNQQGTEESHPIGAKAENVIYNASVTSAADSVNTKIKETDAHIAKEAVSDEDGVHGLRYRNDVFEVKNSVGQQVTAGGGGDEGDMTKDEFVDPSTGLIKVSKGGTGNATGNIDVSKITGILPVGKGGTGNSKGYVQIGSKPSVTVGNYSTAEGAQNEITGNYSHAEGYSGTCASTYSHIEGVNCIINQYASCSHAEGSSNRITPSSNSSGVHVEGVSTTALGEGAHAEGEGTCAAGRFTHAEGYKSYAIGSGAHAEGGTYISTQIPGGKAIGNGSHAEGCKTTAFGDNSHAEGYYTSAVGIGSHAEGGYYTNASGFEGTKAIGNNSHAEGCATTASGEESHAEGQHTKALGERSHAEGSGTYALGRYSHAEGAGCTTGGENAQGAHAEGNATYAQGDSSHAEGSHTTAESNQHVQGHFNIKLTGGGSSGEDGTAFIIGSGTSSTAKNAFNVKYNGQVNYASSSNSPNQDYAEFFEQKDNNKENEDRIGYFVTFDEGRKIKLATSNDEYILGIISGAPSVVGNSDCDTWNGMVVKDEFNRVQYEPNPKYEINKETGELEPVLDEEGNQVYEGIRSVINPDYDSSQEYISRWDRPEWAAVGMLGVLPVRDDGTCEVNGYCTVANGGIATKADENSINKYRVIGRKTENVIEVVFR